MFLRNQSRLYDTGRMSVGTQWHPVGASASHWLARVHCDKNDRDRVIPRWSTNYWTVKTRQRTGDSCTRWPACETLTLASGSSNTLTARLAFAIDFLRFQVLDHGAMRERERERERIFIKINRNNDTIIIQCMDYTDWSKETCIKTLKIASMQATLMLINSIIIIVTNYLAVLPIVEVHKTVT